jgi:hypothetical protein
LTLAQLVVKMVPLEEMAMMVLVDSVPQLLGHLMAPLGYRAVVYPVSQEQMVPVVAVVVLVAEVKVSVQPVKIMLVVLAVAVVLVVVQEKVVRPGLVVVLLLRSLSIVPPVRLCRYC